METTTVEKKVFTPRNYICSKEKYLELKALQKKMIETGRLDRQAHVAYVTARRKFYHDKGMTVPNHWGYDEKRNVAIDYDKENGFKYEGPESGFFDKEEARYLNIIYSIVRGKPYDKIEQKVQEGNEISEFRMEKYCKQFGIDFSAVKKFIWPYDTEKVAPKDGIGKTTLKISRRA
jgi:hypothetical protein